MSLWTIKTPKPTGVLVSQQLYNDKFSKILLLFFEKNDWDDGHTIKFYQKNIE
jgi:hypothetical protein